jgi:tripartite-type tricarboxylate transporter receptor subunit TctC
MKRLLTTALLCLAGISAVGQSAQAAGASDYPNRPIRLIVGYVAGGIPDGLARVLGEALSKQLGQQVVVENRPGAGGTISAAFTAKSQPDGYTLTLAGTGQTGIAPYLFKNPGYDPLKSFAQIGMVANTPMYIVCNPQKKPDLCTVDGLIKAAKARPNEISYGSSGLGSGHHIAMEVFMAEAGIKLVHIPYKGSGQALTPILSGEVDTLITSLPPVEGYLKTGQIKVLAITTKDPSPLVPDAAPLAKWVPGYDYPAENGLMAPAGTPKEIVDKLSVALKAALQSPELIERFRLLDSEIAFSTEDAYRDLIRKNLKKYERATKLAGLTPN